MNLSFQVALISLLLQKQIQTHTAIRKTETEEVRKTNEIAVLQSNSHH